jgi:NADPH-dependent 7-cyano-7-deazaguanine reductase QueF-like protein
MSVEHSLLGKDTQYPTQYQPEFYFQFPVLSLVNSICMLKALHKVKTGGMYLKFHG